MKKLNHKGFSIYQFYLFQIFSQIFFLKFHPKLFTILYLIFSRILGFNSFYKIYKIIILILISEGVGIEFILIDTFLILYQQYLN